MFKKSRISIIILILCFSAYTLLPLKVLADSKIITQKNYSIDIETFGPVEYGLIDASEMDSDLSYSEYLEYKELEKIEESYRQFITDYANKNIILNLTFEDYQDYYEKATNIDIDSYIVNLDENQSSVINPGIDTYGSISDGPLEYYYNTGLNYSPLYNYSKYNILAKIKKGDMIFENKGFYGLSGHTAIVEGKIYQPYVKKYYIRLIEAISVGVCRGVLDSNRVDDRQVYVKRPKNVTSTQINNALDFARSQLGKPYKLDFKKNTSASEKNWYCSELYWASYYNQGINLEKPIGINEPGVTPRDLYYSETFTYINIFK